MINIRRNSGFSIIEMFLSTLAVISLSAISYRVLQKQTNVQMTAIENQKNVNTSKVALNRFKVDASKVDPNWARYGIAAVYPHQGYGFNDNYYLMSSDNRRKISLNDGVTFLRRSVGQDRLYVPSGITERYCYPSATLLKDQVIYGTDLYIDSTSNLNVGDWMMAWQAGNYMLGIITNIGQTSSNPTGNPVARSTTNSGGLSGTQKYIRLRAPNAAEKQATRTNGSGFSTGFVTKPGVVPASFDMMGNATSDSTDDSYCFDTTKMNFQKIDAPVSYYVEYQTNNGASKSSTNAYELDSKRGDKVKMLVRSEYVNGVEKRQYLAPISEVAFFYDLLEEGEIARDVGRNKTSSGLLNISVASPTQTTSNFLTSYKIVAVKMQIDSKTKEQNTGEDFVQSSNVKVAFDPNMQLDIYQDKLDVSSAGTNNLNTLPRITSGTSETIGKPLYLVSGTTHEVIVPVSSIAINNDGSLNSQSDGKLYVYNSEGCAVNSPPNCEPTSQSVVTFNPGANKKFFPSSVTQVTKEDGTRKIYVGGVGMDNSGTTPKRLPGVAVITLSQNTTLESKLDNPNNSDCNIDDCHWYPFDNTLASTSEFVDTANIATNQQDPDTIYIAPMTKTSGKTSQSAVFRATWNGSGFAVDKFANVARTEEGKLVTAISNKTLRVNNEDYLAVCLSKNMSSSCDGECIVSGNPKDIGGTTATGNGKGGIETDLSSEDNQTIVKDTMTTGEIFGEIQLVKMGSTNAIPLIRHNYMCSSLNVDDNQNLIISGRLSVQPLAFNKIKNAVLTSSTISDLLYLDEAIYSNATSTIYADYFKVDPETYSDRRNNLVIGWMTGMSAVEFSDGTFSMVNGNKYRVAPGFMGNTSGSIREFSNAGIASLSLSGMGDRVIATIETDSSNINNSIITASYAPRITELPSIYIPGKFMTKSGRSRTSPTPLPSLPPQLSETSWFTLYQSMLKPKSEAGLNSDMPVLDETYVEVSSCQNTKPKTCE